MQKLKTLLTRHGALFGALLVLVCALLFAAWTWYDLSFTVDNVSQYAIQNDEYSRIVRVPDTGLYQQIELPEDTRLYGVRLNVATYDHAFRTGELAVELVDGQGARLAGTSVTCVGMLDNTFADFLFDAPYTPSGDETLWLRVTFVERGAADTNNFLDRDYPIGLWACRSDKESWPLTDGLGRSYHGTIALQYITNYSGTVSRQVALVLGGCVAVGLTAAFLLLFAAKAPLAAAFAAAALALGVGFAVLTPPMVAPDEYTHLAVSYYRASQLSGQTPVNGEDYLLVRRCDARYFKSVTGDIGIFAYKQAADGLRESGCDAALTAVSNTQADTSRQTVLYLGQIAGVWLARRLGLGYFAMVLLGRLCNLLVYLALATLAVALAPRTVRPVFAAVGLLPMSLQLAASFSADATLLGALFAFTALVLRLREHPAARWELVLLALLTAATAPLKAVYLPVILLLLLIPGAHLGRRGTLWKAGLLALAALLWAAVNLSSLHYAARDLDFVGLARGGLLALVLLAVLAVLALLLRRHPKALHAAKAAAPFGALAAAAVVFYKLTHMYGGLTPEQIAGGIQPNGDSIYTYSVGYVLRNLPGTLKLLARSAADQGALWLQGILGTTLGEPIVYRLDVSWLLGVGLVLALLAAALPAAEGPRLTLSHRERWGAGGVVVCAVALTFVAALSWTPINYATLFGMQGRYWLPVLPLALCLAAGGRTVTAQKPLGRKAVFAVLCLTSLVMLQGYHLYAAWQPVQ